MYTMSLNHQTYKFKCNKFSTRIETDTFGGSRIIDFLVDGYLFRSVTSSEMLCQMRTGNVNETLYLIFPKAVLLPIAMDEFKGYDDPSFEDYLEQINGTAMIVIQLAYYTEIRMYRDGVGIVPKTAAPLDQPLLETPKTTLYQSGKRTKSLAMWEYLKQRPMGGLRPKSE